MPSRPMVTRYISRQIVASSTHCSNNCPGISLDAQSCHYFDQSLTWDPKKKKENGNQRLIKCISRELRLRDED